MSLLCLFLTLIWLGLMVGWYGFWRADRRLPLSLPVKVPVPSVAVIVPARNEADNIARSTASILAQNYPGHFSLIVANDASTDTTGDILSTIKDARFSFVDTAPRPQGWAGKVWALDQAIGKAEATKPDYYWLTDADIVHKPSVLATIVARARQDRLALCSQMVRLPCKTFWEKLLVPAYIFYFSLLYPFKAIADPASPIAGAAGGSILIRRDALEDIGGIAALKGAIIDDCSLARRVKKSGRKVALELSETSFSLRGYETLGEFWQMVQRSAYIQLRHSPLLLLLVLAGLVFSHILPVLLPCLPAWAVMSYIYWPSVRFYHLSPVWALTLPLAATLFGAMTLSSALAHHLGWSNRWRDREISER